MATIQVSGSQNEFHFFGSIFSKQFMSIQVISVYSTPTITPAATTIGLAGFTDFYLTKKYRLDIIA
jgi:hypothetical protein